MSLISMAINHKLRPKYRSIGHSVGEFIAEVTEADAAKRDKIIKASERTASVGLSLLCAAATADAVGFVHALSTSNTGDCWGTGN